MARVLTGTVLTVRIRTIQAQVKYCRFHSVHGTTGFSKLQSTETERVLNSADSCVLFAASLQ